MRIRLSIAFLAICIFHQVSCKKPTPVESTPEPTPSVVVPTPTPAPTPIVVLPSSALSPDGYALIVEFETGGKEYYNKYLKYPSWPGASSGVTVGIGYDLGYNSPQTIRQDWHVLPDVEAVRLSEVSGVTGSRAKTLVGKVRDILIKWEDAEIVFNEVSLTKFIALTRRTFPGFDDLKPNTQAALVSIVFNRGSSLTGSRREEMRVIRDLVPKQDYKGIAQQIKKMKRLWIGTDIERGMSRRRDAEAALVLTDI